MSDAVTVAIIAAAPPTLFSMVSLVLGFMNRNKLTDLHKEVNSRLTQLVASSSDAARAQGHNEGVIEERAKK